MVFYFSGTGNSLYVAEQLQERFSGQIINIAEAVSQNNRRFQLKEKEKVFFVFPVYYAAIPVIVTDFIKTIEFTGDEMPEITGIATFGKSCAGVDRQFNKLISSRGYSVRAFYDIKMVENCVIHLPVPIKEAAWMTLKHSNIRVRDVLDSIEYNYRKIYRSKLSQRIVTRMGSAISRTVLSTRKFVVGDNCIGCGLCKSICPVSAIEMIDGHPVWIKDRCTHCTACINRCPSEAIQYGKMTKKRFRYVHPELKKKDRKLLEVLNGKGI